VLLSGSGDVAVVHGAGGDALYWSRSGGVVSLAERFGISTDIHVAHVSYSGDVLFGSAGDGVDEPEQAFRWSAAAGLQWLGSLPDAPDAVLFRSTHATPDGRVLVGSVGLRDGARDGLFRWSEATGLQRIAVMETRPVQIFVSSSGDTVIGYYSREDDSVASFRWSPGRGASELPGSVSVARTALDGDLIVVQTSDGLQAVKFGRALEGNERLPMDLILSALVPESWHAPQIQKVSANGTAVAGIGRDPSGQKQGWLVRSQERCQ